MAVAMKYRSPKVFPLLEFEVTGVRGERVKAYVSFLRGRLQPSSALRRSAPPYAHTANHAMRFPSRPASNSPGHSSTRRAGAVWPRIKTGRPRLQHRKIHSRAVCVPPASCRLALRGAREARGTASFVTPCSGRFDAPCLYVCPTRSDPDVNSKWPRQAAARPHHHPTRLVR